MIKPKYVNEGALYLIFATNIYYKNVGKKKHVDK